MAFPPNAYSLIDFTNHPSLVSLSAEAELLNEFSPNIHIIKDGPHPFFPEFCEPEQIRKLCYQAGICNAYGEVSEDFKSLPLSIFLEDSTIYAEMIKRIDDSLNLDRKILSATLMYSNGMTLPINVSMKLSELFNYALSLYAEQKDDQKKSPPFLILEIYWIGSSVPQIIGIRFFEAISCVYFKDHIPLCTIKTWFSMEHITKKFRREANDLDFRSIISSGRIENAAMLSDDFLHFVGEKIPDRANGIITDCYKKVLRNNYSPKISYLLSKGIRHRKIVEEEKTKYAIIAYNSDSKPIDISNVCSNEKGPILENLNLSSEYSFGIPLLPFLTGSRQPLDPVAITSEPFGMQTVLDLLFDSATPTTFNHYGWRDFLRKGTRKLRPDDEKKMVENVLANLYDKNFKIVPNHSFLPHASDANTLGGRLYLLLANDFYKIEKECSDIHAEPYYLTGFLFQASQSLLNNSNIKDCDIQKMWHCVEHYYWKPNSRISSSNSIYTSIKNALIDEKIPFTILSSWMGILAYLWCPNRATVHCDIPVIHLKKPFFAICPIKPVLDGQHIDNYFSTHLFSKAFHNIYEAMAHAHQALIIDFPLTGHISSLEIDLHALKEITDRWIKQGPSPLNLIGLQIYLQNYPLLPDLQLFIFVIRNLPSLLSSLVHLQQKQAFIQTLSSISESKAPFYHPFINHFLRYNFKSSTPGKWIEFFIEMGTPDSIHFAYTLWKENDRCLRGKGNEKMAWRLYNALSGPHFHLALTLFRPLMLHYSLNTPQDEIDQIVHLLSCYETQPSGLKFPILDGVVDNLYSFVDFKEVMVFKNTSQKEEFSSSFCALIDDLLQFSSFEDVGDYFLLQGSRLGYLPEEQLHSRWSDRIIQLIVQDKARYGAILYIVANKENWIQTEQLFEKKHVKLGVKLGQALLKENECTLSIALFKQLSESSNKRGTGTITQLLLDYLQNRSLHYFEGDDKEILEAILTITFPENLSEVSKGLLLYFTNILQQISFSKMNFPYPMLDKILLDRSLISIMDNSPEDWKKLLLNYLKGSGCISSKERSLQLWEIFERTGRLFTNKNQTQRLQLFERLADLLDASSPPSKIVKWIENGGQTILKQLEENNKLEALKILLTSISSHRIPLPTFNDYVWRLGKNELQTERLSDETCRLLLSIEFESLRQSISLQDYCLLPQLAECLLDRYPEQPPHFLPLVNGLLKINHEDQNHFNQLHFNDLLLRYAEQLMKYFLYREAAGLLKILTPTDPNQKEKIETLHWSAVELFLPTASLKEVIRLFSTGEHNKKNGIPNSIAQQIISKFFIPLSSSEEELAFILDVMKASELQDLGLWSQVWKRLNDGSLTPNKSALISNCWKSHRTIASKLVGDSSVFMEYWSHVLSCLNKIAHHDLISFLDKTDWPVPLEGHSISKEKIFTFIILGAIKLLDSDNLDESLFEKIMLRNNFYSEKIFQKKNKLDKQAVKDWNNKIEMSLIDHLSHSIRIPAVLRCCSLLQSKLLDLLPEQSAGQQILTSIKKQIEHFSKMEAEDETRGGDYRKIKELNLFFYEWLGNHEKIPVSFLLELLGFTDNQTFEDTYVFTGKIFPSIINRSSKLEMGELKRILFNLTSKILLSQKIESMGMILELISLLKMRKCPLSNLEKETEAELSFSLFANVFSQKLTSSQYLEEKDIDFLVHLYISHAPHLIIKPELFKKGLDLAASLVPLIKYVKNADDTYIYFLDSLLSITSTVDVTMKYPMDHYELMVFKAVHQAGMDDLALIQYFKKYGEDWLNQFKNDPAQSIQAMRAIETVAYFFPPIYYSLEHRKKSDHNSLSPLHIHWTLVEDLIQKASDLNLIAQFHSKLTALSIWMDPLSSQNENCNSAIQHQQIDLLCSFNTHLESCIWRSIVILRLLLKKSMNASTKLTPALQSSFDKVLKTIDKHEPIEGEKGKIRLYLELFEATFSAIERKNKKFHDLLVKIANIFYPYSLGFIRILSNHPELGAMQIACLETHLIHTRNINLTCQSISEHFPIIKKLESAQPIIRETIIQNEINPSSWLNKYQYSPSELIINFTRMLTSPIQIKNGKALINDSPFNRSRRKLLLEWLDSISAEKENDINERKCSALIISMITTILNMENAGDNCYWLASEEEFGQEVKKKMFMTIEEYGTLEEKLAFKSLFIFFDVTEKGKEENRGKIIELLNFNDEMTPSKKFLATMKIVLLTVIQWSPERNKKNRFVDLNPPQLQEAFESFLFKIKKIVEKTSPHISHSVRHFLIGFTIMGFENQWLREDRPLCVKFILWVKSLEIDPILVFEPALSLIFSLAEEDSEKFINKITEWLGDLAEYVVSTKQLYNSWSFVRLITILPLTMDQKKALMDNWIYGFRRCKMKSMEEQKIFVDHLTAVIDYFTKTTQIEVKKPTFRTQIQTGEDISRLTFTTTSSYSLNSLTREFCIPNSVKRE